MFEVVCMFTWGRKEEKQPIRAKMLLFISLLVLLLSQGGAASPISCYNDRGDAVDWFYMYKLPKDDSSKFAAQGLMYLLLEKGSDAWVEGKGALNDTAGALGRTVGQLYSRAKGTEVAYILYNDQKPVGAAPAEGWPGDRNWEAGHTKGVVILDQTQGFWLVHSIPKFPLAQQTGEFQYPASGLNNGQSLICITFPLATFQTVGEQLQINQPSVYDCHVPQSLASLLPALAAVCKRQHQSGHGFLSARPVSNRSVSLTSKDGTRFINFAKGASFNADLYHSWVGPSLQSDLLVQFWSRTRGVLPSDCSQHLKVLNVKFLSPGKTFSFRSTRDHSKWAVSPRPTGSGGGWVCVGDINRDKAEEARGGGTVCLQDPVVWKAYQTAALECEACGGGTVQCSKASG